MRFMVKERVRHVVISSHASLQGRVIGKDNIQCNSIQVKCEVIEKTSQDESDG